LRVTGSVRFSPHFLRTENRTDRIFSELNRTRIELVRTGSTCSVQFQNRFKQANWTILYINDTKYISKRNVTKPGTTHLEMLLREVHNLLGLLHNFVMKLGAMRNVVLFGCGVLVHEKSTEALLFDKSKRLKMRWLAKRVIK
jgi:hypothetical protein